MLLVDDEELLLRGIARSIKDHYDVTVATSPTAALELLHTRSFDVVLSDYRMPGGQTGVELLTAVKRLFPQTRRVLYTGTPPPDISAHVASGVVEAFILKPADVEMILAALMGG